MSKAFALAGIRVGWMASRSSEIIEACAAARDFTTIAVSQLDDKVATFAMDQSCVHALLGRNITLAKKNVAILEKFIDEHRGMCEWIKPRAGTTAMVKFYRNGAPVDDVAFCKSLQEKVGVMFAPGNHCFAESGEFPGYVRIGYVCETEILTEGLEQVDKFLMGDDFAKIALIL
jgi:aspartate/methionine/tyrosine aminotransferase